MIDRDAHESSGLTGFVRSEGVVVPTEEELKALKRIDKGDTLVNVAQDCDDGRVSVCD